MTRKIDRYRDIVAHLEATGWKRKQGTWAWYNDTGRYRYKMNDISVRYEKKTEFGWVKLGGGYYKNISIVDGKLEGIR